MGFARVTESVNDPVVWLNWVAPSGIPVASAVMARLTIAQQTRRSVAGRSLRQSGHSLMILSDASSRSVRAFDVSDSVSACHRASRSSVVAKGGSGGFSSSVMSRLPSVSSR